MTLIAHLKGKGVLIIDTPRFRNKCEQRCLSRGSCGGVAGLRAARSGGLDLDILTLRLPLARFAGVFS